MAVCWKAFTTGFGNYFPRFLGIEAKVGTTLEGQLPFTAKSTLSLASVLLPLLIPSSGNHASCSFWVEWYGSSIRCVMASVTVQAMTSFPKFLLSL